VDQVLWPLAIFCSIFCGLPAARCQTRCSHYCDERSRASNSGSTEAEQTAALDPCGVFDQWTRAPCFTVISSVDNCVPDLEPLGVRGAGAACGAIFRRHGGKHLRLV
jgi:hypothetical protein